MTFGTIDLEGGGATGEVVDLGIGPEDVEAAEDLEAIADVVVDAVRKVPIAEAVGGAGEEVVETGGPGAGPVEFPQVADDDLAGRVDAVARDNVAGEGSSSDDVVVDLGSPGVVDGALAADGVEGAGEVPGAFGVGGECLLNGARFNGAPRFIRGEGEELIFDNGGSDCGAPDVLFGEIGPAVDAIGEGIDGWIAAEEVGGAFQVVRPGLHGDGEYAAGGVAELGVNGILLEVDFRDCVHGGRIGRLLAGHGGGAIENNVVFGGGATADVELAGGPVMEGALFGGGSNDDGGIERGEEEGVAVDDGQVVGHLRIDGQAHAGSIELERDGGGFHRDRFLGGACLQGSVDRNVGAGLDEDFFGDELGEADHFDGDGVGSGGDKVEQVLSVGIGLGRDGSGGVVIEKGDGGTDDHGIGGVADTALNFAASILSPSGGYGEQQGARKE